MKKLLVALLMLAAMNASAQWVVQSNNLFVELQEVQYTSANTGFIAAHETGTDYFIKTTNGGTNWNLSPLPYLTSTFVHLSFINDNTGWICGTFQGYSVVLKTTNQGQTWDSTHINNTYVPIDIQFINSNTGYLLSKVYGVGNKFLKTTNSGSNWITQHSTNVNQETYNMQFLNSNTGYIAGTDTTTQNTLIYKTTNGGVNWNSIIVGTEFHCDNLYFVDENKGYTTSSVGHISKTTNGGYNWVSQTVPNWQKYLTSVYFLNANIGYIVGFDGSSNTSIIKKTTNGGTNWIDQTNGSNSILNSVYFVDVYTGWTVGWGRVFKTTNGGSTFINSISTEIPTKYSLGQNYPNPFNSMCNVQFTMCNAGNVRLVVYDIMGREVETLVNERLKPGTYEASFDGSMLNSGVYFYRLVTGDFTETKKMLLIK